MIRKDVISTESAEKIKEFYKEKQPEARNQLFVVFVFWVEYCWVWLD
jgi:hypothetical protein